MLDKIIGEGDASDLDAITFSFNAFI